MSNLSRVYMIRVDKGAGDAHGDMAGQGMGMQPGMKLETNMGLGMKDGTWDY